MQELLPPKRKPHPTAKAFFDALDLHQHQQKEEVEEENDDDDSDDDDDDGNDMEKKKTTSASASTKTKTTKTKTGTMMSRSLQRKCQSLEWRNRYSQNEYYPICLNLNLNLNLNLRKKEKISTRHHHQQQQQQQQQQQYNRVVPTEDEDENEDENEADGNKIEINDDDATQRQQQQQQQEEQEHQCNSINNKNNKTTVVNFSVKQVQRGEVDGTYGTGATVWPAALVLIKYLEYNTANANANANANINTSSRSQNNYVNVNVDVVGKHIIDLGSGTGVTSIAAAILGAKSIVCTDGIDPVVQLAKDNIQRVVAATTTTTATTTANDAEKRPIVTSSTRTPIPVINNCPIRTQKYWWGEEGTAKTIITSLCNDDGNDSKSDDRTNNNDNANANANIESNNKNNNNGLIILVADCVLPKLYPIEPLVQAIDECLMIYDDETNTDNNSNNNNTNNSNACASACAILSYEYRYYTTDYDPKNEFIKLATAKGLDLYTVPKCDQDPIYSTDDIELWIVTRNKITTKRTKAKSKAMKATQSSTMTTLT